MPTAPEQDEDIALDPGPEPPVRYAEQALLGALLLDPGQLDRVKELQPEHFHGASHRAVYVAMRTLTPPEPDLHRKEPVWLNAVLTRARTQAPGVTAAYLHTMVNACPVPRHAAAYARMVRADHARRTLREHAMRLEQMTTDATLPDPAAAIDEQTAAIEQFVEELAAKFTQRSAPLPRTPLPAPPQREMSEEAIEEERLLLATATHHPSALKELPLRAEDFGVPLHGQLYQCLTGLAHRGEDIDPITVLWEAQQRGLTADRDPNELLTLLTQPAGSPESWAEQILHCALLSCARTAAVHIGAITQDLANTTGQLIAGTRRALADLAALRARHARHQPPRAPKATSPSARAPTPSARAEPALNTHRRTRR